MFELKVLFEPKDRLKGISKTKCTEIIKQYKKLEIETISLYIVRYSKENSRLPKVSYILLEEKDKKQFLNRYKKNNLFKLIKIYDFYNNKETIKDLSNDLYFTINNNLDNIPIDLNEFTIFDLVVGDKIMFSFYIAYVDMLDFKNNKIILKDSKGNTKEYTVPVFKKYFGGLYDNL